MKKFNKYLLVIIAVVIIAYGAYHNRVIEPFPCQNCGKTGFTPRGKK